jgi:phospho-N-acetylmuramoyl-pentapeptide-transferase
MLNMIAGSVLPITAFIGVFFAFAATCILTSFLNDWLPRDMGREFAHNGKLSAGKPRGAGIIFISVFCIAALERCLWRCLFILFLFLLKC